MEDDLEYLSEDPELAFMRYCVMSFVSPETVLKNKDRWMFARFRKAYVVQTRIKVWENFCAFLSQKYGLDITEVMKQYDEFKTIHEKTPDVEYGDIDEAWKVFLLHNEKTLEEEFSKEVGYQTTVRGVKLRWVGENEEEVKRRARKFVNMDKGKFRTVIGYGGKWLPWDPTENMMGEEKVQNANEALNELLKENEKDVEMRKELFEDDKNTRIARIREETAKQKEKNEMIRQAEQEKAKTEALTGTGLSNSVVSA